MRFGFCGKAGLCWRGAGAAGVGVIFSPHPAANHFSFLLRNEVGYLPVQGAQKCCCRVEPAMAWGRDL